MAYLSIALLIVSISFLAYKHSPASLNSLSPWLLPRKRTESHDGKETKRANTGTAPSGGEAPSGPEVCIQLEEPSQEETTPKAKPGETDNPVPTFLLVEDAIPMDGAEQKKFHSPKLKNSAPAFPTANSPQRTSSLGPPQAERVPTPMQKPTANLMPPPQRPASNPPPSAAASLRVPTTGPLPNRGPPLHSQQRASGGLAPIGGLAPNGSVSTPNKRGKVLLSPGHSPMDWAVLSRSKNLSGVTTFQRVTPSALKSMTGRKGKPAWSSWQGKVYNITPYVDFHPGGKAEIMRAAGRDGTDLFMEVHPWVNWENMLGSCLVGVMVPEEYGMGEGGSLEDMD